MYHTARSEQCTAKSPCSDFEEKCAIPYGLHTNHLLGDIPWRTRGFVALSRTYRANPKILKKSLWHCSRVIKSMRQPTTIDEDHMRPKNNLDNAGLIWVGGKGRSHRNGAKLFSPLNSRASWRAQFISPTSMRYVFVLLYSLNIYGLGMADVMKLEWVNE